MRSAFVKSLRILSDAAANFFFSYSSLAKPFTTRIARTFSSTDSLSLSYFLNTARNAGSACFAIIRSPKTRNGTMITKVIASLPPMINAIVIANRNITGALTAMRIHIINAIWILLMSVVILVTSEAAENLSIFSNAKP